MKAMSRSNRVAWMILALLTVVVGIWFFTRRTIPPADPQDASSTRDPQTSGTALSGSPLNKDPLAQPNTVAQRGLVPVTLRVLDTQARPIEGALASWTPARTDWIARTVSESDRPWEEIEAGTTLAPCRADGTVELAFDVRERAVV